MYDVIIIGAGASGLMAAATAASKGARVALFRAQGDDIGKKILATGNGRCNFTNTDMSVNKFHGSKALIKNGLSQFNHADTIRFFKNLEYLHMTMLATFIQIQGRQHLLWQPFEWSL